MANLTESFTAITAESRLRFEALYQASMEATDPTQLGESHVTLSAIRNEVGHYSVTPHLDRVRGKRSEDSNFPGQVELVQDMSRKIQAVYQKMAAQSGSSSPPPSPSLPPVDLPVPKPSSALSIGGMFARLRKRCFPPSPVKAPPPSSIRPQRVTLSPNFHTMTSPAPSLTTAAAAPLDMGVGFENSSANCWINALLQMIIQEPNLRLAYETIARFYSQDPLRVWHANALKAALEAYETCFIQQMTEQRSVPVPAEVSQNVRIAFHELFKDPVTFQPVFSHEPWKQEDAGEALGFLLARYADILEGEGVSQGNYPSFFFNLRSTRQFIPVGQPYHAPNIDGYSELVHNQISKTEIEFQILLDLGTYPPGITFNQLMDNFFNSTQVSGSELTTYIVGDNALQKFVPTQDNQQLQSAPEQLILTLKRFGWKMDGTVGKVQHQIDIPPTLLLPPHATTLGKTLMYELTSVIFHRGSELNSGHWLCYRKMGGRWYEFNDSKVNEMQDSWMRVVLQQSTIHQYSLVPDSTQTAEPSSSVPPAPNFPPISSAPLPPLPEPIMTPAPLAVHTPPQDAELEKLGAIIENLKAMQFLEGPQLHTALQTLSLIEPAICHQFEFFVWLHDLMPTTFEYGKQKLQENPNILKLVTYPLAWHTETPSHLLAQMLQMYEQKYTIANIRSCAHEVPEMAAELQKMENRRIAQQLRAYSQLLDCGYNNEQLTIAFHQLNIPAEWKQKIYQEIDPSFGEATMKDHAAYLSELRKKDPSRDILGLLITELEV
ncbi:MAG: ubiquitin carboxyl-terminal hydrolase family protein [Chlamydiota bacterium]